VLCGSRANDNGGTKDEEAEYAGQIRTE